MKQLHFTFSLFFLLACLAEYPAVAADQPNQADVIKVGIIIPLSGEAAALGESVRNGLMLGMEDLPPAAKDRIELIFEDDALQSKNSVTAFNKLTASPDMDIIVNISSGTAHALAPLAESKKIPFIALASDHRIVENKKYSVLFWVTPLEEANIAIPEALRRGYKRVARVTTIQEGVFSMRAAFDQVSQDRVSAVLDEDYPPDIKDFKTFIAKIRSQKNLDAVFPLLLPGQCGTFAKQLRQAGVTLPIFSMEMFEDLSEVAAADGALDGAWYVNAAEPDGKFLARYKKAFPKVTQFGAGNAHDLIMILASTLDKDSSREGINKVLHELKNFSGVLGTYSATGDNRFTLPAAIKIVEKTS